jgi:hypothetical protein
VRNTVVCAYSYRQVFYFFLLLIFAKNFELGDDFKQVRIQHLLLYLEVENVLKLSAR